MANNEQDVNEIPPTVKVKVSILQGRNLVPKDRNFLGVAYSSDPYIKLHYKNVLHETKVKKKTLFPSWDDEEFIIEITEEELQQIKQGHKRSLSLHIFDKDFLSSDDFMGEVIVPLDLEQQGTVWYVEEQCTTPVWYNVGTGPEDLKCKNATGEIQVKLSVIGATHT